MKSEFIKEFGELCKKYNIKDIEKMEYVEDYPDELVIATYKNGYTKKAYVTLDSCKAMIADIIRQELI